MGCFGWGQKVYVEKVYVCFSVLYLLGVRQTSGEGIVRRNGCLKGNLWRVRFFAAPLRFVLTTSENLKGAEKKRLSKNTLLDDRFSARRLLRSFGASPQIIIVELISVVPVLALPNRMVF